VLGSPNRPLAIVSMGDQFSYQLIAGGEQNYFRPTGSLFLYLARDTNPDYYEDRVSAEFDAWNFFGSVLTDVIDLAAADDADSPFDPEESHLSIVDMDVQAWGETDKKNWESLGRFFWAAARVVWGDGT
jgi:hypothetical protein